MIGKQVWLPYCGPAPGPAGWLAAWNLDPVLLAALAGAALIALRRPSADRSVQRARLGAVAVAALLFVTPLCALGSALFSVRATHHVLLAVALGPLLAHALALHRRRLPGSLAQWTALQAVALWCWHAPPAYAAALSSDALFWAMQVSITGAAAVWFAHLRQSGAATTVIALLATMVQMGLLGALLVFAGRAFYAPHLLTTAAWGLAPLEDQQLAGLIMWVPGSAAYLLAAVTLLYRSLGPEPAR